MSRGTRVPRGDAPGFDAFARSAGPRLFRTAVLLTGDRHRAEDLLQSAFERVYRTWSDGDPPLDPAAYTRRVLVNLATDRWRRARHLLEVPWGDVPDRESPHARDATDAVDLHDTLLPALAGLPPRMRAVIVMRYWDDLPDPEVAAVLGCSVATVRSQASRGLERLRGALGTGRGEAIPGPLPGPPPGPAPGPVPGSVLPAAHRAPTVPFAFMSGAGRGPV